MNQKMKMIKKRKKNNKKHPLKNKKDLNKNLKWQAKSIQMMKIYSQLKRKIKNKKTMKTMNFKFILILIIRNF